MLTEARAGAQQLLSWSSGILATISIKRIRRSGTLAKHACPRLCFVRKWRPFALALVAPHLLISVYDFGSD